MNTTDIGYLGLAASLLLIAVMIAISYWQRLGVEWSVLWAVARGLGQLVLVGLALELVLDEGRWLGWSWLWVGVIVVTAAVTVRARAPEIPHIGWSALGAYALALAACLGVVFGLDVFPLEARTLVPVAGMIVGNSMRAAIVTGRNLADLLAERRADIESRMALGLSGREALRPSLRSALRLGLLPQIDTTRTVGLVFLPGAMTGLILAGVDPEDAVLVQAALLFLILGSAAIAATVVGLWTTSRAITPDERLIHVERADLPAVPGFANRYGCCANLSPMASGGSTRAILAAMFANMGIAIAKFVGFLVTSSSSMLAESVHSVADTTNQALLLWGGRRAKREATREHPFGYGRERYFWAFVVALILFSLGSLFAIYEGIEKIRHPEELESLGVAIGILVFGVLLEAYSLRTAVVESNHVRGDASWTQFVRRSRSPELPVVLLEDIGAMFGLVVALFAVVMAEVTGEPRWDGVGTLCIGIVLGLIAIVLAVEMKSLLIGEGAVPADRERLVDAIESDPLVDRIIHLRTQHLGPDELMVAAKIHFDESLDVGELAGAIDDLEARMRDAVPVARVIYVEPDLFRSGAASDA